MSGSHARDVLLKVRWAKGDMKDLVIDYISRGSPDDIARFSGEDIALIGRSFLTLKDGTMLPYHRIVTIEGGAGRLLSRRSKDVDVEDHHVL